MNLCSDLGFEPAGAHDAPARHGLENGEQSRRHKNQPDPQMEVHRNDAGDEAQCPDDPAGESAPMADIGLKESVHDIKFSMSRAENNPANGDNRPDTLPFALTLTLPRPTGDGKFVYAFSYLLCFKAMNASGWIDCFGSDRSQRIRRSW
jgi:hypothetical protein